LGDIPSSNQGPDNIFKPSNSNMRSNTPTLPEESPSTAQQHNSNNYQVKLYRVGAIINDCLG
jgi:hypothetical protein